MRGMFTCGVIDVFLENHIVFDAAAGISAGAAFGCNFKSRQIGRPIRYNKQYCRDPRYCSFRSLLKTGDLYGAEFCYHTLPDELDVFDRAAFQADPMVFYAGATDVETGAAAFHRCVDAGAEDIAWLRASASMPFVSRPVEIGGRFYLDGGIADAVPYRYMEELGFDRNVIVLTQPKGYEKKKSPGSPLYGLLLRRYPAVARAMATRHDMYNGQLREIMQREEAGVSLVIRPPEALGIHRTEKNPRELERVYQIGCREAEKRLGDIKRFLGIG